MLYLLLAAALIIIGCFSLVFCFDKRQSIEVRKFLVTIFIICAVFVVIIAYFLIKNPLLV